MCLKHLLCWQALTETEECTQWIVFVVRSLWGKLKQLLIICSPYQPLSKVRSKLSMVQQNRAVIKLLRVKNHEQQSWKVHEHSHKKMRLMGPVVSVMAPGVLLGVLYYVNSCFFNRHLMEESGTTVVSMGSLNSLPVVTSRSCLLLSQASQDLQHLVWLCCFSLTFCSAAFNTHTKTCSLIHTYNTDLTDDLLTFCKYFSLHFLIWFNSV